MLLEHPAHVRNTDSDGWGYLLSLLVLRSRL